MSISITVNGQSGPSITATTGDTIGVTVSPSAAPGPTGPQGPAGPSNSLTIGTVASGSTASATITGTAPSQTLSLVLPKGDAGTAIELQANSTHLQWRYVGASSWTNLVSLSAITGPTGSTGAAGTAVELQATSTHLQWRYVGGSSWTNVFALSSLVGATGPQGPAGPAGPPINLGDETPQPLGSASAGTALTASRADHSHAVPVVTYSSLLGTPSTFAPSAHQHPVSDVTGLQAALDAKASLVNGTVPSSQLPSFVDDVREAASLSAFPATGDAGVIYVAVDTKKIYRWSGSAYIEISPSPGTTTDVPEGTNLYYTDARAAAAAPVQTVAGRTGDIVISTTDVEGLTESLANVNVDVIDGGDYVGVVVTPTPSITITAQPSSQSVSTSSANEVASTLPSGTWGPISRVNSQWITSGYQSTLADYLAVSTDGASWTKRYGLPSAGLWSAVQYQDGVYATQAGNVVAYSSDATTWSSATFTNSRGSVFGAGGKFLRATRTGIFTSTDAATWTQTATNTSSSQSIAFAYENSTYFAVEQNQAIRASTDGSTWTLIADSFYNAAISSAVTFASGVHLGFNSTWPLRYASGTVSSGASTFGSTGGQFATNGSVLVFFAHTGKIYSSTNGTTFVERTLPTTLTTGGQIARLFYSGGTFALVMQYGLSGGATTTDPGTVFFTSTNGVEWTQNTRTYPTYVTTGGSYVANGYLASHNGSSWNYIQIGASNAVASFTVSAYLASGTLTYQWQLSTDAGTTWANVSGATSATLSLSGLTTADNGKRYQCIVSATGVASVTTNSATLTVT